MREIQSPRGLQGFSFVLPWAKIAGVHRLANNNYNSTWPRRLALSLDPSICNVK